TDIDDAFVPRLDKDILVIPGLRQGDLPCFRHFQQGEEETDDLLLIATSLKQLGHVDMFTQLQFSPEVADFLVNAEFLVLDVVLWFGSNGFQYLGEGVEKHQNILAWKLL